MMKQVLYKILYALPVWLYRHADSEVRNFIKQDMEAAGVSDFIYLFKQGAGFRKLFYVRLQNGGKYTTLTRVCLRISKPLPQFEIFWNEGIGGGLRIYHQQGCVLNALKIGTNVKICQNVTVGKGKNTEVGNRAIIGDNVYIGTNAVILGGVKIGNNVTIGAQSFVNKDIPDHAVVAGVPARILCYKENL